MSVGSERKRRVAMRMLMKNTNPWKSTADKINKKTKHHHIITQKYNNTRTNKSANGNKAAGKFIKNIEYIN